MKRLVLTMGVICAGAFTLTNCSKVEVQEPVTGVPFEISASAEATRTVNDGLNTTWTSTDNINLFHAETGTSSYVNDNAFTYEDANLFKGTLAVGLEAGKSYDWYALCPYSSYVKTPAATDEGYINIGSVSNSVQEGNDSQEHLISTICPLAGVATNVGSNSPVNISMKQLTSVVMVKVTNATSAPLTVTNVTLSAAADNDIVGTYYVDFHDMSNIVYTPSGERYVSNVAPLTVKNAEPIAAGESACFYIPVKPFTSDIRDLKLSVNGYERSIDKSGSVTFEAGVINTVNFSYNQSSSVTSVTKSISEMSGTTTNGTKVSTMTLDSNITLVASAGTNNGKVYQNGAQWRFYQGENGTLTIKAASGHTLKSASFTFTVERTGCLMYNGTQVKSGEVVSLSGDSAIFSVKNTASATNGQVRFTSITVTYE